MAAVFRFFDLPTELRNLIYRKLARQGSTSIRLPFHDQAVPKRAWHAVIGPYVFPDLLSISKRFKTEYEDETYREAELGLLFNPWAASLARVQPMLLPGNLLGAVRHVHLEVILGQWLETREMLEDKYTILRSLCLPSAQTVKIQFLIQRPFVQKWFDNDQATVDHIDEFFSRVQTFSAACKELHRTANIEVGVYLRDILCLPKLDPRLLNVSLGVVQELKQRVDKLGLGSIVYRATPSKEGDRYSFYGLQLDMKSCEPFNVEGYIALVDRAVKESEDDSEGAEDSEDEEDSDDANDDDDEASDKEDDGDAD